MGDDVKGIASIGSLLQQLSGIQSLEEACVELAKQLIIAMIAVLDEILLQMKPKGYKVEGYRTRSIETRLGTIPIRRRLYTKATKKEGRGRGRFLLDEFLQLPPRRQIVGDLLKLGVSLCTRLPFRQAAEVLKEAVKESRSRVHQGSADHSVRGASIS